MLKLLFIPTGNVFTLPDEEALKIKAQDRANEYRILDAGYVEPEEPKQISEEDISELVLKAEQRKEEIEAEDAREEAEQQEKEAEPERNTIDFSKYKREELVGWLRRFNIPANVKENKATLIQKCIDAGINA